MMTDAEKMMLADAIETAITSTRLIKRWKRISTILAVICGVLFLCIALNA